MKFFISPVILKAPFENAKIMGIYNYYFLNLLLKSGLRKNAANYFKDQKTTYNSSCYSHASW